MKRMYRRTRIKVCGMTRREDALFAASLGVDALGFIFTRKSPRYVEPDRAAGIAAALPPLVSRVGVFVDATSEEIAEIVRSVGLNGVQLHGRENAGDCLALSKILPSCDIFKAMRIGEHSAKDDIAPFEGVVSGYVLDTYVQGIGGGTGKVFDWDIIPRLGMAGPYLLAGGLSPENIGAALRSAAPYGVDVNSGVESAPGFKDHEKLSRLVGLVRDFDMEKA